MTEKATLRGLRALVTGAGGFIGSNLCLALAEAAAEVHGVVRPRGRRGRLDEMEGGVVVHETDLCDAAGLARTVELACPDLIFHAAVHNAYAKQTNVGEVVRDNVLALANLLDATAEMPYHRLIYLGSFLEYGPSTEPHCETDPLRPDSLRGVTKAAATLLALQESRVKPIVVLRLFSVYGPGESFERLIPRAIRAGLLDEPLPLTKPGLRRDLVFVGDVADACVQAAAAGGVVGEVINVAGGREVANEEIVAGVEQLRGTRLRVRVGAFPPRPTDRPHCVADIGKAERLLGWRPRHGLAEGLAKTVPWVRRQIEAAVAP